MAQPCKTTGSDVNASRHGGKKRSFHQALVLNRWVLVFFQGGTLAALKKCLCDDRFEDIDGDGQTKFFHELTRGLFDSNKIPEADLRCYDLNIVAHWQRQDVTIKQYLYYFQAGRRDQFPDKIILLTSNEGLSQQQLLILNAFVLSPTKFADLLNVGDPTKKSDLENHHVLFMEDGASIYLKKLFACLV